MILIMWGYTTQYIGVTLSQFIVGNPIKQRVHRGTEGFEHRVICILKLNTEMSWLYLRYIEYKPCFATFDKWLGHTENSLQTISSLSRSDALFVALHDSEWCVLKWVALWKHKRHWKTLLPRQDLGADGSCRCRWFLKVGWSMLIASEDCFWFRGWGWGGEPFLASRLGEIRGILERIRTCFVLPGLATQDLKRYLPREMRWVKQVGATCHQIVPWHQSPSEHPQAPRLSQTYMSRLLIC